MAQGLTLHRPNQITWGMALFSGLLGASAAALLAAAIRDAHGSHHRVALHAGPPLVWLLVGLLALASLTLSAWRWKRGCYGEALVASVLSLGVTLLLLGVAAVTYRKAMAVQIPHSCVVATCAVSAYPDTARRSVGAMVLLIIDLVAVALIVLNAVDGYAGRPILPAIEIEGGVP